jgi:acetyl esterase
MRRTIMPTNHTSAPLDSDAQAVADMFAVALPAGLSGLGVEGVRAFAAQTEAQTPPAAEVNQVTEHAAPGPHGDVRVRLYRPDSKLPVPVLLYIHGGGWTMGSIDGGVDYLCRDIVRTNNIAVASVDYRLAPEHKFPVPFEDCQAALAWLRGNAAELGLDSALIAIGGDSVGGNISAAITHSDRGHDKPLVAQVLLCPATEYAVERTSWIEHANAPVLTAADTLWFWDQYLSTEADRIDPRATPANAESFADLPQALVIVAGHDPLRDDGLHYAELLNSAGTSVEVAQFDGSFHDFFVLPALAAYAGARDTITGFLDRALVTRNALATEGATS